MSDNNSDYNGGGASTTSCDDNEIGIACYDTTVSGNNLVTALVVDTIIGLLCYIGFVLWRSSFSIYSRRKWLPNRIRRPPKLHLQGHWRIWSWLIPTWNVPDIELLRSSGFDALVAVRIVSFGIPLFIPYVVLGIAVLLPVNYHGGYLAEEAEKDGNSDSASSGNLTYEFLRLSISNIKPSSSLLWVHFVVLTALMFWTFFLVLVFWEEHISVGHKVLMSEQGSPQNALELHYNLKDSDSSEGGSLDGTRSVVERGEDTEVIEDDSGANGAHDIEQVMPSSSMKQIPSVPSENISSRNSISRPYSLWPVRRARIPDESRPPGAGKYVVLVVDEIPRYFRSSKTSKLGLGISNMKDSDFNQIEEFELETLGKYEEEEAVKSTAPQLPRMLTRLRSSKVDTEETPNQSAGAAASISGLRSLSQNSNSDSYMSQNPELTSNKRGLNPYHRIDVIFNQVSDWASSIWDAIYVLLPGHAVSAQEITKKRMEVIEATYRRIFGEDFDRIVSIYPTKKLDAVLMKLYACQEAISRLKWTIEEAPKMGKALSAKRMAKLTKRLQKFESKELELQKEALRVKEKAIADGPCACFFAIFHTATAANAAAHINPNTVTWRSFRVTKAPDADQVNYMALERTIIGRNVRQGISIILTIFIMLLPIGLITGLFSQLSIALCGGSQGEAGSLTGKWFCSDDFWAGLLRDIITGVLPSILMAVYQAVLLPIYLYTCANLESRHFSLSELDRRIAQLGFLWNVFNFFLGALLGGTIFNGLRDAIDNPRNIFSILGNAIPASSNFFINYVMYRSLAMGTFRLFFPHAEISARIAQWFRVLPSPKAPVDIARSSPLRPCRYSRDFSVSVFTVYIATIAYSCIAPIIIPFGLLYFIICFFVWRYQALYVYQSSYRANYVFTWAAHRIVACIGITVVFMASMFIVKKAIVQAILCLVLLLPIVIVFDLYIKARYDVLYHALPCAVLETAPRVNLDPELYVSPPMRKGAQGWFLEWGKAWEFFGAPRGYF